MPFIKGEEGEEGVGPGGLPIYDRLAIAVVCVLIFFRYGNLHCTLVFTVGPGSPVLSSGAAGSLTCGAHPIAPNGGGNLPAR